MALAALGVGVGVLVHQTASAMAVKPVPPSNTNYFSQPINVKAALGIANPGQQPTQSYQTGEMTQPEFMPAGRDQNELIFAVESQISAEQQHYQRAMYKHFQNGGDKIVIPNNNEVVPILTHHSEPYAAAYVGRNNLKSANASARLLRGGGLPIPGAIMGDANWARK